MHSDTPGVKRRFPRTLWYGLAVIVAAPILYLSLFIRFPETRDTPWPSLAMFGLGLGLLIHALRHAFRESAVYRGKVFTPLALTFGMALTGFFCWTLLVETRNIPAALGAPRPGQMAPDFTLPDENGQPVSLARLIASPDAGAATGATAPPDAANTSNGVVLVFYRGYW